LREVEKFDRAIRGGDREKSLKGRLFAGAVACGWGEARASVTQTGCRDTWVLATRIESTKNKGEKRDSVLANGEREVQDLNSKYTAKRKDEGQD